MGCGASTGGKTGPKLVAATGDAAVITGGVVAGAAVAGPLAPLGAIIGGVIAAAAVGTVGGHLRKTLGIERLTLQEVHQLVGDVVQIPGRLLDDKWRILTNSKEVLDQLPVIGLLRLDRGDALMPPVMLDKIMSCNTNSCMFRVHPVTVTGLDDVTVRAGKPLSVAQGAALEAALTELAKVGAIAVVGDSGMLAHYQALCAEKTSLPVMLSPLLQAPLLATVLHPKTTILVVTSDSSTFSQAELEKLLLEKGQLIQEAADAERFVLKGLEHIPGFADPATPISLDATQDALLQMIASAQNELVAKGTPVGAVLFESAMLPAFSDVVRKEVKLPVVDNLTLVDFALKARTDNPRFGISFGTTVTAKRLDPSAIPSVGVLRIDYKYPPALGDVAHPGSYYYQTHHATWKGLTFEAAQEGKPLTEPLRGAMNSAVATLEGQSVMGIAGDCGFLMNYQEDVRQTCKLPCYISALLQCSVLSALFGQDEYILVLTANGPSLSPHMPQLLSLNHVTSPAHQARFLVAGCQDLPGFDAVAKGEAVDVDKVMPHVVDLVKAEVAKQPAIQAVLLECTELPPYADAVRAATGLPVLDSITLVDFFHAAVSENPYFGIDWEKLANTPTFQGDE